MLYVLSPRPHFPADDVRDFVHNLHFLATEFKTTKFHNKAELKVKEQQLSL